MYITKELEVQTCVLWAHSHSAALVGSAILWHQNQTELTHSHSLHHYHPLNSTTQYIAFIEMWKYAIDLVVLTITIFMTHSAYKVCGSHGNKNR